MTAIQPTELEGLIVPIITPMHQNGSKCSIDYNKLHEILVDLVNANVDVICPGGTTGQSELLTYNEQIDLIEFAWKCVNELEKKVGFVKDLIAGINPTSTDNAVRLCQDIEKRIKEPMTFMSVVGCNNVSQRGIMDYFGTLTYGIEGNVMLYNNTSRTNSNIEAETAIALSKNPKIIGIKDSSADMGKLKKIIRNTDPNEFRVIAGNDYKIVDIIKAGGYGAVASTANVAPALMEKMVWLALDGSREKLREAYRLQKEVSLIANVVARREELACVFATDVRSPLINLSLSNAEKARHIDYIINSYSPEKLGMDISKYRIC